MRFFGLPTLAACRPRRAPDTGALTCRTPRHGLWLPPAFSRRSLPLLYLSSSRRCLACHRRLAAYMLTERRDLAVRLPAAPSPMLISIFSLYYTAAGTARRPTIACGATTLPGSCSNITTTAAA